LLITETLTVDRLVADYQIVFAEQCRIKAIVFNLVAVIDRVMII
jgi:hypothetical protein